MVEKKAFPSNQSINIVYPNVENMIIVPITKRMEIIIGIQVLLILRMNINFKEIGWKKKLLLRNQSSISVYPNKENMFMVPNNKKKEDYYKNP